MLHISFVPYRIMHNLYYLMTSYRTCALLSACAYISTGRECALICELHLVKSSTYSRTHRTCCQAVQTMPYILLLLLEGVVIFALYERLMQRNRHRIAGIIRTCRRLIILQETFRIGLKIPKTWYAHSDCNSIELTIDCNVCWRLQWMGQGACACEWYAFNKWLVSLIVVRTS